MKRIMKDHLELVVLVGMVAVAVQVIGIKMVRILLEAVAVHLTRTQRFAPKSFIHKAIERGMDI